MVNVIKRVALIDGDVLAYRCGFAAQHKEYSVFVLPEWGALFTSRRKKEAEEWLNNLKEDEDWNHAYMEEHEHTEPLGHTLHTAKMIINRTLEDTDAEEYKIYLSGASNFRDEVATLQPYKGNRKDARKPTHLEDIRNYLRERYNAILVEGIEADDQISIEARKINASQGRLAVVCSVDKDLKQIPGLHYNFATKEHDYVSDEEALVFLYTQILMGDPVDNIQGIKGIGPKKAAKILNGAKQEEEMWERVVKAYIEFDVYEEKKSLTTKEVEKIALAKAQENAELVYILQEEGKRWRNPDGQKRES